MKKFVLMGAALTMAFAMTSCRSSESAYKKAYEKAQANNTAATTVTTPTTTTTNTVAVTPVNTTPTQDYSNVPVRTENIALVSGAPLKAYSVVVGSFGVQTNATGLANTLAGKGYASRVVSAVVNGNTMYRVVASSFDTKAEAGASRASLETQYPGAWLLYQK